MIELRHLSITSGAFHLRDISLTLNQGEYVALMGRTGQGKTTIVEAIAGLRTVTSGQIMIEGVDVTRLPPASRGVGYVPQDLALFPTMTVKIWSSPCAYAAPPTRLAPRPLPTGWD